MVKLKCWKKTDIDEWHSYKKSGKITNSAFIVKTKDNDYLVDSFYGEMRNLDIPLKKRRFKQKLSALKFVNKYMKDHDNC